MDDLGRFILGWTVELAVIVTLYHVGRVLFRPIPLIEDEAPSRPQARLRLWAFPLLYTAAACGSVGLHRIDDALMTPVHRFGWALVWRDD